MSQYGLQGALQVVLLQLYTLISRVHYGTFCWPYLYYWSSNENIGKSGKIKEFIKELEYHIGIAWWFMIQITSVVLVHIIAWSPYTPVSFISLTQTLGIDSHNYCTKLATKEGESPLTLTLPYITLASRHPERVALPAQQALCVG